MDKFTTTKFDPEGVRGVRRTAGFNMKVLLALVVILHPWSNLVPVHKFLVGTLGNKVRL